MGVISYILLIKREYTRWAPQQFEEMMIMSEFRCYFVRKISNMERSKEKSLFSWDEKSNEWDRWQFFDISKLPIVISWAKQHQWRCKSNSQAFSCNIAWSPQKSHTSVSPKSVLAITITPKSIIVQVHLPSDGSDTQSDRISSTKHTKLFSWLELSMLWQWLKPQQWLQTHGAKTSRRI